MTPEQQAILRQLCKAVAESSFHGLVLVEPLPYSPTCRDDGESLPGVPFVVRVRLYRVGRPRHAVSLSSAMAALAHELAHFHCWRHGRAHREETRWIADCLRHRGYPVAHKVHANVGGRKGKYGR